MLLKTITISAVLLAVIGGLLLWQPILAADQPKSDLINFSQGLTNSAVDAKLVSEENKDKVSAYQILGQVINFTLGLIGALFLILTVYGGLQWMTARGNEEQATKAMEMIAKAAIGMAIIIGAFLITNYVVFKIIGIAQ